MKMVLKRAGLLSKLTSTTLTPVNPELLLNGEASLLDG
jgi:hypothetical protein